MTMALIMAGGRGEGLYPLTAYRPKPAVPFGGVFRIIDFTLSNCLNSGLSRVCLLTQYKHEELQTYIQQSWSALWTGMRREPLVCLPPTAGKRYRGTADAVFQNIAELRGSESEFVLILPADQVYQMDYRKLLRYHAETNADVTIATVGQSSMGVYVFKRKVLMQALSDSCDEEKEYDLGHHIIPSLIGSAHIQAYDFRDEAKDVPGYWRDIGTLDSYYETTMDLVRLDTPFDPYANEDWPPYPAPYRGSPPPLHTNCRVTRSILSPGVRIEDGSLIESSVLMSRVWVGENARIRRAIIEEGVHIPAGFEIGFDLEEDRKNYFVTGAGVVVVRQTPKHTQPTLSLEVHEHV